MKREVRYGGVTGRVYCRDIFFLLFAATLGDQRSNSIMGSEGKEREGKQREERRGTSLQMGKEM